MLAWSYSTKYLSGLPVLLTQVILAHNLTYTQSTDSHMWNSSALRSVSWRNRKFTAGQGWPCLIVLAHLSSCLTKRGTRTEERKSSLGRVPVVPGLTQIITVPMPTHQCCPAALVTAGLLHGFAQHFPTDTAQSSSCLSVWTDTFALHPCFLWVCTGQCRNYSLCSARRGLRLQLLPSQPAVLCRADGRCAAEPQQKYHSTWRKSGESKHRRERCNKYFS